jgi:hypothetical protein
VCTFKAWHMEDWVFRIKFLCFGNYDSRNRYCCGDGRYCRRSVYPAATRSGGMILQMKSEYAYIQESLGNQRERQEASERLFIHDQAQDPAAGKPPLLRRYKIKHNPNSRDFPVEATLSTSPNGRDYYRWRYLSRLKSAG